MLVLNISRDLESGNWVARNSRDGRGDAGNGNIMERNRDIRVDMRCFHRAHAGNYS